MGSVHDEQRAQLFRVQLPIHQQEKGRKNFNGCQLDRAAHPVLTLMIIVLPLLTSKICVSMELTGRTAACN